MLFSNALYPIITKPTRITSHSATLIDHIYTNSSNLDLTAGILTLDITDHLPIFCLLSDNKFRSEKPVIYYRDCRKFNKDTYLCDLKNTNWDILYDNDINISTKNILNTIQNIINKHAPMKLASRSKLKQINKPWLTRGIIRSAKHKQKMYHAIMKNPHDTEKLSKYKKYSNVLNNIIQNRKTIFLAKQFESNKLNLRKTWTIIGHLVKRKSKAHTFLTKLTINDNDYTDKKDIANQFNKLFTNIGPELAS
jgi:hypothetical protein